MEGKIINIDHKRKLLYKRKRKRQLMFRITIMLIMFCILSLIVALNNMSKKNSIINNKVKLAASNEVISPKDKITVCIDPGHGDWDIGTKGKTGVLEKDITLNIALRLGQLLEAEGIKVVYTRTNDSLTWLETSNDSLKERIKIPEIFNADLFISIHCNSNYDDLNSRGIEVWHKPADDAAIELSNTLKTSLMKLKYTEDRGLKTYEDKEEALAVLELNKSTSALIELGFLSNTLDERYLGSKTGQENCAKAIKQGILAYIENKQEKSN